MIPWLGGNWIGMAKLIIHNADIQLAGADDPRPPARTETVEQLIQVWPIGDIVGDPKMLKKQGTNRICYRIGNKNSGEPIIFLQTRGSKFQEYSWVVLAEPPGKLTSNREEGLSRNLWEGLEWDPGDDQER